MRFPKKVTAYVLAGLFGVSFGVHSQDDLLTQPVTDDLASQCAGAYSGGNAGYDSCVTALHYHGSGDDESAKKALFLHAPSNAAEARYKVALVLPKDGFWKIVATAGSGVSNCRSELAATLAAHFEFDPKALSDADDDAAKNPYLALADLLKISHDAPPGWRGLSSIGTSPRTPSAQIYRVCFSDPANQLRLFESVKKTLGR